MLTGMGNDKPYFSVFDHLVLDACQVTNPSIDPLREPMELRTYLGAKPDAVEVEADGAAASASSPVPACATTSSSRRPSCSRR